MLSLRKLWVGILSIAFFSVSAWAGAGPSGHNHSEHNHGAVYSAGEPGDPAKPARIIQVTMTETDGRMLFLPARIEIKKGDQIKFVLRNNGKLDHEFVLAGTAENREHAKNMKANPDMTHEAERKAARSQHDWSDRLEIHQGWRVRIRLSDPRSSRSGYGWDDRRQVNCRSVSARLHEFAVSAILTQTLRL